MRNTPASDARDPLLDRAGEGRIAVERQGRCSVVTHAFARSPLRLLTPSNHGHAAWIYTSNFGGGLVDGDRVELDVSVGRGAAAFLSTQASTKVYRSPRGTSARLNGRVEPDGLLIVAPDPVVCFAAARYRQVQRFLVAAAGALVVVDWLASGRRAAGERWAFAEYRSVLEITLGDRLLVHDALALREDDGQLEQRLGRFDVLAVAVVAGEMLASHVRVLLASFGDSTVGRRADLLIGVSPLASAACVLRVAGTSVEAVGRALRESLRFVPERLGDDPWTRRF